MEGINRKKVAIGILRGQSYVEIAKEIGIAEKTVKMHVRYLLRIFDIVNDKLRHPQIRLAIALHASRPDLCGCQGATNGCTITVRERTREEQTRELSEHSSVSETMLSRRNGIGHEELLESSRLRSTVS